MVYACTEGETELTHELCLRAIKAYGKASAVGQRLSYIIPVIDRMFSMHWENPRTLEPYTPLPLPSPEEAAAYFEQYGDVTPRTDMLIVRAMEALREFGESESSRGQYLKIMRRFHWRCFKAGEMYYRPELYAEYPDSERELTAQGKQKSWKSEIARRCGPVLAVVAASGVIPDDIFRREDFKFADPGLEEIHRALRIWIGKERGLSGACISLHRYVLRFTIEGSSSSSADELKRIGKAELDLILELFSRKCSVSSRATLMPLLSDVLKKDAVQAVKDLKALNIKNIQMLSGDKQSIVNAFARKLGITRAYGDLLPEGKVKHLEELRKDARNRIAFVGDGINDAPVLALSHVGIAMGGLGSDAAIETADVVIQTDQPSKVATAIRAGKATRRIVWQNITLALGIKILVLLLGAAGLANLWEAVFADVGVALIAIMNAMRVQRLIK